VINSLIAPEWETVAKHFVTSRDPAVILWMRGCLPVAVNAAYERTFSSDRGKFRAVNRAGELAPLTVEACKRYHADEREKDSAEGVHSDDASDCYCERRALKAMLALRIADCVHELNWGKLVLERTGGPLSDIEFFLQSAEDPTGPRVYRIGRLHTDSLPPLSVDGQPFEDRLLLVRVNYVPELALIVRDDVEQENRLYASVAAWPETQTRVETPPTSGMLLAERSYAVRRDIEPYHRLEQGLDEAIDVLEHAREGGLVGPILERAVNDIKEEAGDEAYRVVDHLLRSMQADKDGLITRLRSLRRRLWDACTVSRPIREQLNGFVQHKAFKYRCADLPDHAANHCLRMADSLDERIALDGSRLPTE